jgi:hypothetical protein
MATPIITSARAAKAAKAARTKQLHVDIDYLDLHAYMPTHQYIYIPTGELWSATSVDNRLPKRILCDARGVPVLGDDGQAVELKASVWLDKMRHVEQMTWCPGKPKILPDTVVSEGGWVPHPGATCYNLYRPPLLLFGDAALADPWIAHVRRVYPDDADHLFTWFAHRVQHPSDKINHALVMGGNQGIGKDTILEPIKHAVGPWNFAEISPSHLMGRFNGFTKSVILRVNEARDLGDVDRFSFYDHTKIYTAAPPDVIRVDEKNLREHAVFNVCGVLITVNQKNGIHLDPDDRRHYVAWSDSSKEDFALAYFPTLYTWFAAGGIGHVVAWLKAYDLTAFDAKRPPTHTSAWQDIVDAGRASEDADLADALDRLGNPSAVTLQMLAAPPTEKGFSEWLMDPKSRKAIPHRLKAVGYTPLRNPWTKDGFWVVSGRRQNIYAATSLSARERLTAAQDLVASDPAVF